MTSQHKIAPFFILFYSISHFPSFIIRYLFVNLSPTTDIKFGECQDYIVLVSTVYPASYVVAAQEEIFIK